MEIGSRLYFAPVDWWIACDDAQPVLPRILRDNQRVGCGICHTKLTRIPCYTYSVQRNLTLTVDDDLLRAARKVAIDRNTSVNHLVRDYLAQLVREADQRQAALADMEDIPHGARQRRTHDVGPR